MRSYLLQAIPEANIWWMYKETEINNGSTLVNDIDMRQYYYVNSVGSTAWKRKSELFLSATSVDDNGTFSCIAGNKAGKAKAEFTLHVVVPMPPKPPQVNWHHDSLTILASIQKLAVPWDLFSIFGEKTWMPNGREKTEKDNNDAGIAHMVVTGRSIRYLHNVWKSAQKVSFKPCCKMRLLALIFIHCEWCEEMVELHCNQRA